MCAFHAAAPYDLRTSDWVQADHLPPQGTPVRVSVDSYEAMHWNDCDGGDPVPDFEKNGVYETFEHMGIKYWHFTPDSPR